MSRGKLQTKMSRTWGSECKVVEVEEDIPKRLKVVTRNRRKTNLPMKRSQTSESELMKAETKVGENIPKRVIIRNRRKTNLRMQRSQTSESGSMKAGANVREDIPKRIIIRNRGKTNLRMQRSQTSKSESMKAEANVGEDMPKRVIIRNRGKMNLRMQRSQTSELESMKAEAKVEEDVGKRLKIIIKSRISLNVLDRPFRRFEDEYELEDELGKSHFGYVNRCRRKRGNRSGELVACKSFIKEYIHMKSDGRREYVNDLKQEIKIMEILSNHPNVISILDVLEDEQTVNIVMELCSGGDLRKRLRDVGPFCEQDAAIIFKQLIEAIKYCHDNGIVHRDVKPGNILLCMDADSVGNSKSDSFQIKLADFGLSTYCKPGKYLQGKAGTDAYMAPEVWDGRKYNQTADVWSAGAVLYALLSGQIHSSSFWSDTESEVIPFPSDKLSSVSDSAIDLIRWMLRTDCNHRPTTDQILDHPWITGGQEIDNVLSFVGSVQQHAEETTDGKDSSAIY